MSLIIKTLSYILLSYTLIKLSETKKPKNVDKRFHYFGIVRYNYCQFLGKGAYSSVYKVQRIADQEFYALKKVKLLNLSEK